MKRKDYVPEIWQDQINEGNIPADIPERPDFFYMKEWKGWDDFMGTEGWDIEDRDDIIWED